MQLADLPLVQQQPLGPVRILVEDVALVIGGDMHPVGKNLSVLGLAIGILQIQRTGPDALDLRAEQLHPGLIAILHEIVMERLAVLGGDLNAFFLHGGPPFSGWYSIAHFFPHCKSEGPLFWSEKVDTFSEP